MRFGASLSVLLLCTSVQLPAQDAPTRRLVATHLGTADGLPQGLVSQMIQDRSGYLWMGTKDGLARYDGYSFTVFRHDEADSTSIIGNHITALVEDRVGHIWVGTQRRGICRYDPATGRFQRVVRADKGPPVQSVSGMVHDAWGNIWVRSDTLWVIPPPGANAVPVLRDPKDLIAGMSPVTPYTLSLSRGTDLWICDRDSLMVFRTDGERLVEERRWPTPMNARSDSRYRDASFAVADDARGQVLIWAHGSVVRVDAESLVPIDTVRVELSERTLTHLVDRNGLLWCWVKDPQVFTADPRTGQLEEIALVRPDGSPLPVQGILTPELEDRDGNIWLITDAQGVYRVDPRTGRFQVHRPPAFRDPTPADLRGEFLFQNAPNELLDARGMKLPDEVLGMPEDEPLGFGEFNNCVVDPEGRVLTGWAEYKRERIVLAWRDGQGTWRTSADTLLGAVPREVFPGMGYDAWVAACGPDRVFIRMLLRMDMRTGKVVRRYDLPIPARMDMYPGIAKMLPGTGGNVWLATTAGLMRLDTASGKWETWTHDNGDPNSLPNNMVFSLCADPQEPEHVLWVGTEGGGLARFDLRTNRFRTYTTGQGLPNNVIYGILADDEGHLWLSTNQGLCHFDPQRGVLRNYDRSDGLPDNEFNRYSFARMRNGSCWFGSMGGTVSFHPADFHGTTAPSPTRITGLRILNQLVGPRERPDLLTAPVDQLTELVLPYNIPMLTFDFACMDLTRPERNTFRYRLMGLDSTWVDAGTNHQATFTNLSPGRYRLEVQGRNSAGVWDREGASIALTITPPWWGTWWFRIVLVLVVAGMIYALFRYRLAQRMRLAHVRDRIARDLHDEIGSTLSSVALFSEVAKRRSDATESGRNDMLDRISESTSRMVESMNDIVWAVNSRNDELLHVAQRMQEFAGRVSEAVGFDLDFSFEGIDEDQELDMVQRKNLYLIFKEAVNNAAKYSGCGKLTVRVEHVGRDVVLRITDDGRGMDLSNGAPGNGHGGGNGLKNMRARAGEMNGQLKVESAPGRGTTVELRFKP